MQGTKNFYLKIYEYYVYNGDLNNQPLTTCDRSGPEVRRDWCTERLAAAWKTQAPRNKYTKKVLELNS